MKKFFAGVVLGFLASWTFAAAAPSLGHDGAFWNKLNTSAKDGYINGYSDAMQFSLAKLDTLESAADLFHWKGGRRIIRQLGAQLSMADLAPDQAVKRLDELYSNQKYSELDLGQALQYLRWRASETRIPPASPEPSK